MASNAQASLIVTPTSWSNGDTVTAAKLNGNQNAITTVVNGDLDNTNLASGYKLFQVVPTLPSAGNHGAVAFLTSNNTLNLDSGSAWLSTVTPSGTLATGQIPYYNSGWQLLSPSSSGLALVSNGSSSLPSYQAVSLSSGITSTLAISHGGTGQTTQQAAIDALLPSQTGKSGYFLTSNGTNSSWTTNPALSNVLFQYSASVNAAGSRTGEVENASLTAASPTANYRYMIANTSTAVFTTKWQKIAGVSTVTVYAQLWVNSNTGTITTTVGSASGNTTTTGSTPGAWVNFTIDVSSLTNGTVYDVTVTLNQSDSGSNTYMGSLIAFGS